MARERNISNEQILYLLINLREEEAKRDIYTDIVVNKEACKEIGIFNYKIKETGENRASRLFLISETHNGEPVSIIYDEKGRIIAWKDQEKLQIAQDIELEEERINRQLELGIERTKGPANASSSSDTSKSGEGRDLADKEHEEKEEVKNQDEGNVKIENNEEKTKLPNLANEINIDDKPLIELDQVINGYYLWEILQIEDKLEGRLPDGISEREFRDGYLTIVPSSELEAKDGKPRKAEDTFVISNSKGDIIELDEQILQPKDIGAKNDPRKAEDERSNMRYNDGEEVERPDSNVDATRTSLYQIPDVGDKFSVGENWFLGVDQNKEYMERSERPIAGNTKEISFVQVERDNSKYYESEERIQNTLECKLDPINEPGPLTAKEEEKKEELVERDANEVENVREDHTQELVDKCFSRYEDLRRTLQ